MKKILVGIAVGIFAAVIISGVVWGILNYENKARVFLSTKAL